jgi:hypothetical protein
MDVYQKVLIKLMELTGGKETVDVDLVDLLKKEGFYPSIDNIRDYMSSESWITETSRRNVIRITHWGVAAAKKAGNSTPDSQKAIKKEAVKLGAIAKELSVMIEEFAASPNEEKIGRIEANVSKLATGVQGIKTIM